MQSLHKKAKELFDSGTIQVLIGYGAGSGDRIRPIFVRKGEEVSKLIWDDRCRQNLAVYLQKPEIKKMGLPAITATPVVVRTIIQLIAEHQIEIGSVTVLVLENNEIQELTDASGLEKYAESHPIVFPPHVKKEIQDLAEMPVKDRFQFWQDELSRCFKCYACRAACPLCYCEKCITENNQPQWVCVAPHAQGNYEWHFNRAMHLAGRCVQCGSCNIACPVGIPIALLPIEASRIVAGEFGFEPGLKCDAASALSSFKGEDKETFIQ